MSKTIDATDTAKINKQIDKINKQIEKNNAAYKKATKAQKRVMIAQDVLAQLKAKRYVAESGIFVEVSYKDNVDLDKINDTTSVQKLFAHKEIETCRVCALGGMFMSCTNLNNNTTLEQLDTEGRELGSAIENDEEISNGLDEVFTKNQMILIENYFEGGNGYFDEDSDCADSRFYKSIDFDRVRAFRYKYEDDDKRLGAIMKNIVENNGTFVPKTLEV